LVKENGKLAALFTGSHYLNSGTISATGTATNFAVAQITGGSLKFSIYITEIGGFIQ
jgi:hypothetical protein